MRFMLHSQGPQRLLQLGVSAMALWFGTSQNSGSFSPRVCVLFFSFPSMVSVVPVDISAQGLVTS